MTVYLNPGSITTNGNSNSTYWFHACPEDVCHCFDTLFEEWQMEQDKGPIEDPINAPDKQDPSPDLPEPNTGNDDEDDTEEAADLGEEIAEGDADG